MCENKKRNISPTCHEKHNGMILAKGAHVQGIQGPKSQI